MLHMRSHFAGGGQPVYFNKGWPWLVQICLADNAMLLRSKSAMVPVTGTDGQDRARPIPAFAPRKT